MKIRFRKKTIQEWLVLFVFSMPFAFFLLMNIFHLPSLVKYTVDIAWLGLLFLLSIRRGNLPNRHAKIMAEIVGAFFVFTLIGFLMNYQSITYYLWGIRNNARFFVFFFACICFLDERSIESCFQFMDKLFWINLPVSLYQFFLMGKRQDYLGGIFGVEVGCNGYINIFFMLILTKSILKYMKQQEPIRLCLSKCATAMLISALAELKVFFVEFLLIIILCSLITKFSLRKLWIFIGGSIIVVISLRIIAVLFPRYSDWFNISSIWEIISSKSGYTSKNDMNRMTAVAISLERFLPTIHQKLFGLGLGNCDFASFDFLVTPFYKAHNKLHYMWFSSSFLILETGLIGLTLYASFFIYVFVSANKLYKSKCVNEDYCQIAYVLSIICLVLIIYNNSMRVEAAYMMYFVLSLPFVKKQKLALKPAGNI